MKNLIYRAGIGFMLLTCLVYYSCRKEENLYPETSKTVSANEALINKAKTWYKENSMLPASDNGSDIRVKGYLVNWKAYSLDTNSAGVKVISIPISPLKDNLKHNNAFYMEMSILVDKAGITQGMIKEYMGNPYVGESQLNLYTGSGRLFMSGIYRADTKELKLTGPNGGLLTVSQRINGKAGAKLMSGGDGDGGTLEEVTIHGNPPPPTPPIIFLPPGNPTTPPTNPGIPVSPGGGGGSSSGTPNSGNKDIVDNLTNECLKIALTKAKGVNGQNFTDTISKIITSLDANTKVKVGVSNVSELFDSQGNVVDGKTTGYNYDGGVFSCSILLNESVLNSATQEYAVATIIHETLHAYLQYKAGSDLNHGKNHEEISKNYIIPFVNLMKSIFPNLDLKDATAIAWGGVRETSLWKESYKNYTFKVGGTDQTMDFSTLQGLQNAHHSGFADNSTPLCPKK
ncbi:SprT-like domain-containing protein [Pedobacter sp. 22226]|uniref:SprT-like domain-containing protein n=1 Tax=Pedobacter sp. 22226 TaxID=3453894 RepID=UPI003F851997